MRLLTYQNLDLRKVRASFDKVRAAIEADDFRSADVKKLHAGRYYRARLDYANRLLLSFARVPTADGGQETVCLALEVIENHAYERSRFLRGARVDAARIDAEPVVERQAPELTADAEALRCLNTNRPSFELLDKPLVFDDVQDAIRRQPAPLVLIGSAGSGKTAVTLSRLREIPGQVRYVTLSAYLAQSARSQYAAHGYSNPQQEVEFLSYRDFLALIAIPPGREVTLTDFRGWYERQRAATRALGELDSHALYEEFRGVIGAPPEGPLSLAAYETLGVRQSLLPPSQRAAAHALFERYRHWLVEAGLQDANLLAFEWRTRLAALASDERPSCDFLIVDEVQDLTAVQLALLLDTLSKPGHFMLCGDSHQIVHPNFFSWSALKSMFWRGLAGESAEGHGLALLSANFRNTRRVTALANRLLEIKHQRFGSVDRESNFLVQAMTAAEGEVRLLSARDPGLKTLDAAIRQSTAWAVIVLRDEDKPAARELFRTPLLFSVHEAKGLEYPNVVLFNQVSGERQAYAEVCAGVDADVLGADELGYRRARDKSDKSLETYKFYVNALYVAMTRAVETLTLVEADSGHPLFPLLALSAGVAGAAPSLRNSSREEWAQEARKLVLQGKTEQAQAIRESFLQQRPVPWTPWDRAQIEAVASRALDPRSPGNKPRQTLLDYALFHGQPGWILDLAAQKFGPAQSLLHTTGEFGVGGLLDRSWEGAEVRRRAEQARRAIQNVRERLLQSVSAKQTREALRQADQYGVDHPTVAGGTLLMLAARAGNLALVQALLDRGADPERRDEFGHTAWQQALCRAMDDAGFLGASLPALFDVLAPAVLDVQIDGRLVRLSRQQAEYWLLSLMLAGLKSHWSRSEPRDEETSAVTTGFTAGRLSTILRGLPEWLWPAKRDQRYVTSVLSRAERDSSYRPARRLWFRATHGAYLPNPALQLRRPAEDVTRSEDWQPVYEAMALDWIGCGCRSHFATLTRGLSLLLSMQHASRLTAADPTEPPAAQ